MRVFLASTNPGKLRELRAIFAGSELAVHPIAEYREVAEGAASYRDNAFAKAAGLRAQLQAANLDGAVLADDSGLEVAALGGRPGVLSARYGGKVGFAQRRAMILTELRGLEAARRDAKFVCAMTLLRSDGRRIDGYGEVAGRIAPAEAGTNGFGYDAIFFYPPAGCTFAQLDEAEKNRVSHRFLAAQALLRAMRT